MKKHAWIAVGLLAFAPLAAADHGKVAAVETTKSPGAKAEPVTADVIVTRYLAAIGGEKLLRTGKTFSYTVSGEKAGKKFTKTVYQARPNLMRVDVETADGPMSKGFDGKVAWTKKGAAPAESMSAEDTIGMKAHADFEESLLDYAKKGTKVALVGRSDVGGAAAYDLEVTFASGDVEHQFLDASSYLLVKRTFTAKDKDGKTSTMAVRFGDYKKVAGRMINHSVEWDGPDGKPSKSSVANASFDKPVDAKLFAMPK
ncbi:MAG: hypothetical protein ABI867_03580 [Kofleriaceae bacterium]